MALVFVAVVLASCIHEASATTTERWSRDGKQASADEINSYYGLAHCGWEAARFLEVSWPFGSDSTSQSKLRQYVRDPQGVLEVPALQHAFQAEATLPADAAPTGYEREGTALWLAASDQVRTAYLVNEGLGRVEAWPRADPPIGCD